MIERRLYMRIYALMQTNPQKMWTYDEIARSLNAVKKTVYSRCLDLYNEGMIDKVIVKTDNPKYRKALLFIKKKPQVYPSWLVPASPTINLICNTKLSASHRLDDDDAEPRQSLVR